MTPDGIKERFDLYRKWFKTFLIKEFLNLPIKYQERFLELVNSFIDDCKRIMEEGKTIKEQIIKTRVLSIETVDNSEYYNVLCSIDKSEEMIKLVCPLNKSKPKIGAILYHTVFSLDNKVWYSSKEELITKGR